MREILFRGKRVDGNNNWAYGSVITNSKLYYIINTNNVNVGENNTIGNTSVQPIIPETVGQFTGLTDKNGVKIFEGDVLAVLGIAESCVVIHDRQMSCFRLKPNESSKDKMITYGFEETEPLDEIQVIGNIHKPK